MFTHHPEVKLVTNGTAPSTIWSYTPSYGATDIGLRIVGFESGSNERLFAGERRVTVMVDSGQVQFVSYPSVIGNDRVIEGPDPVGLTIEVQGQDVVVSVRGSNTEWTWSLVATTHVATI